MAEAEKRKISHRTGIIVGVACLVAIQFVSFLEGRGLSDLPFPLSGVLVWHIGGLLCGAVLGFRLPEKYSVIRMAVTTGISVLLWLYALGSGRAFPCYAACFLGATLLPAALNSLLNSSASPGLTLGAALALADFFWLALYVTPAPPSLSGLMALLMVLQMIGGIALCAGFRTAPSAVVGLPEEETNPRRYEALVYLILIALLFFTINSFLDLTFYRIHAATFPVPALVHLYIWICYPLAGLFIDRHGADRRLLLACLGGNILPVSLLALSEDTFLYWCVYSFVLGSRAVALVYMILVFFRISRCFRCREMVVTLPCMVMLAAFLAVSLFTSRFMGTAHVILWFFFLTAAYSYISSRVQYALTIARVLPPEASASPDRAEGLPRPDAVREVEEMASFTEKYAISAREQDVLKLILAGYSTHAIGAKLHISENTIKTHVRQLLRKSGTRNRTSLVALFFQESERRKKDAERQESGS